MLARERLAVPLSCIYLLFHYLSRGLSASALGTCLVASPWCAQIPSDQLCNNTGSILNLCVMGCVQPTSGCQGPLSSPILRRKFRPNILPSLQKSVPPTPVGLDKMGVIILGELRREGQSSLFSKVGGVGLGESSAVEGSSCGHESGRKDQRNES